MQWTDAQGLLLRRDDVTAWEDGLQPADAARIRAFAEGAEVHIWIAELGGSSFCLEELSCEEQRRAERFRSVRDQLRFRFAHGLLRRLLAAYTGLAPSVLRFRLGRWGKPFLYDENAARSRSLVRFNMSHAKDAVCYALAARCEIGVDLEYVDPHFDWHSAAQVCFSPCERELLDAFPEKERTRAFYRLWTQKEALLKASGVGLNGLTEEGCLKAGVADTSIRLVPFVSSGGYVGSVAVSVLSPAIRFFRYVAKE
ncbi:4'-phosphopantetheinyl transferase family protein [Brevibacillus sp. GCM10020057]|uniref:4'-phosphopantetheinyl transferase family protein n=1 Tax=Brevibacillus sp. GCM10020057 TaxID=3317327 RepID=UPI0036428FD7